MKQSDKPTLNYDEETGELTSGVGPGTVEAFLKAYYGQAQKRIRIASAYFTVKGYDIGTGYLANRSIQFQILVGLEEGASVQSSIIKEVERELSDCWDDLWNAVYQLVQRMESKQFIIRDAREMRDAQGKEIAFHCKYYICDDTILWHGSGNYTGRGLRTTIEQASRIRVQSEITSFIKRFEHDMRQAKDLLPDLLDRLKRWLELVPPFHVYLLMLHQLNKLFAREPEDGLDLPTYYQQAVIMRAVEQVEKYSGAIVVAATGLGKTIIGAEIAYQLRLHKRVKRVILIAPQAVHDEWRRHFKARDFFVEYVNIETLFRDATEGAGAHYQTHQLEQYLAQAGPQTLVLIDEVHRYRNQLKQQFIAFESRRKRKKQPRGSLVYKRLCPVAERGAAVVLLTATPFGTDTQNLNSILRLLPNTYLNPLLNEPDVWITESTEAFMKLQVVTVLGLHDVLKLARKRRDIDGNERLFVQFDNEIRYLPRYIDVHQVSYELPLLNKLQKAFDSGYFSHEYPVLVDFFDDDDRKNKAGAVDTADKNFISAWLSSPSAVHESIFKNLHTLGINDADDGPGGQQALFYEANTSGTTYPKKEDRKKYGYTAPMKLSWLARYEALTPLRNELKAIDCDHKAEKLKEIIQRHCVDQPQKVVVFVKRHPTATFIEGILTKHFGDTLSIACTVHVTPSGHELKKQIYRSNILKEFSPKSHRTKTRIEHNVLICTDADGIGVNLQDANVIVNYDPTEGADTLFQRAGRVLRFTTDAERIVHVYTLIPSAVQQTVQSSAISALRKTFRRMMTRHAKSRHILGLDVMSTDAYMRIDLDDPKTEERLAVEFDYYVATGTDQSHPLFHHVAVREQYCELAKTLREGIHSALYYKQTDDRVAVLIDVNGERRLLLHNVTTGVFENEDDSLATLDLIRCDESAHLAIINPGEVERAAKQAVRLWCEQKKANLDVVTMLCAVYLLPKPKKWSIRPVTEGATQPKTKKWFNKAQ